MSSRLPRAVQYAVKDPVPVAALRRAAARVVTTGCAAGLLMLGPALTPAFAHVGHGDEFQNQGGVRQVKANAESDVLLGVRTTRPEQGPDGLTVPTTAVVDADGKPLIFVKTATTYDPVFVEIGVNQGDRVVVASGIDPTDDVVVEGGLSLYAESKKTQQAEAPGAEAEAGAEAKAETAAGSGGHLPLIGAAAGVAVAVAAGAVLINRRARQGE